MNWTVVTIGFALVAALIAALIAPFFIDWAAYRGAVERNASAILGTDVTVDGEIELRLLPSPRMRLTDTMIGESGALSVQAESVELDVDLIPLLQRELRILDLRVIRPNMRMRIPRGDAPFPSPAARESSTFAGIFGASRTVVENVSVIDGRLSIDDMRTGSQRTVSDIQLSGSATSLDGPLTASGEFTAAGIATRMRLATGIFDGPRLPLSISLQPIGEEATLAFEGAAIVVPSRAAIEGEVMANGGADAIWTANADVSADLDSLLLTNLNLQIGGLPGVELTGAASVPIRENGAVTVNLATRQLDFDRLTAALGTPLTSPLIEGADQPATAPDTAEDTTVGAEGTAALPTATPIPPRESFATLTAFAEPLEQASAMAKALPFPVQAELEVDMLVSHGSLIRQVVVALSVDGDELALDALEAELPGETSVDVYGTFNDGSLSEFSGRAIVQSTQPALLLRWWSGEDAPLVPIEPFLIDADIAIDNAGVRAPQVSIRLGETTAAGQLALVRPVGAEDRGTAEISLSSPDANAADIVSAFSALRQSNLSSGPLPDLLIDLNVTRLKAGALRGASIALDGSLIDGTLSLDNLAAEDFAGAALSARGTIANLTADPVGRLEADLAIPDGAPLAAALRQIAPGVAWAEALARRLAALTPAELTLSVVGEPVAQNAQLSVKADGVMAETALAVELTGGMLQQNWRELPLALSLRAENPASATLLAQLGIAATPDPADTPSQPGALELSLINTPADGVTATVSADLLGTNIAVDGLGGRLDDDAQPFGGQFVIESDDIASLLVATDLELPFTGDVNLRGAFDRTPTGTLAINGLNGGIDGVVLNGDLRFEPEGLVSGALSLGEADLYTLARLVLGADAALGQSPDGAWQNKAFGPQPSLPVQLDLELSSPTLGLGFTTLSDVTLQAQSQPGGLALTGIQGEVFGGTLSGALSITRQDALAEVDGQIDIRDGDLKDVVWIDGERPVASGRFDADVAFASMGYTFAGLVSGLTGSGTIQLQDTAIEHLSPAPFAAMAEAITNGSDVPEDALAELIADHLDGASLDLESFVVPFELAHGVANIGQARVEAGGIDATVSAQLDLSNRTMRSDWSLALSVPEHGRAPADLTFAGALADPTRTINAAATAAWLNLLILEQQVREVEAQNRELEAEADAIDQAVPAAPERSDDEGTRRPAPSETNGQDDRASLPPQRENVNENADAAAPQQASPAASTVREDVATAPAPHFRLNEAIDELDEDIAAFEDRLDGQQDAVRDLLERIAPPSERTPFQMEPEDARLR